ncbi:EAL domain-containing protein [Vibrio cincinnatiensis]|jgi:sensor c-di-GMP phosphodiesterase-like protein|uniref:cyclic-guanylate-specific phosphodiesterase n=1 Tax=Vibrio cincinnatiensis DSM 19608 TaxID=1123491 RepID=A0A1T4RJB8_VIBCI|nr:EAL domain-containing protein [Vibrio cincinnatiensis]SKA15781.1 sensor c-di-GMP phosphodiesterase, contains CSS-motif sensor and EAL domain [Vibrio cincinnatiensis DSM 19608]SUP48422.1 cyclic diguanylate phosphodiesterase (EAL) domain-containing protein [Vibrio cincinnatiensis]
MKKGLQNSKKRWLLKVFITCLLPFPLLFIYAYCSSLDSIQHQLHNIANAYAARIETLIFDLHSENKKALYGSKNCDQIQEELLFESLLREMFIIENQQIVCSSKRGEMQSDVSQYYPDGIVTTKERFFDLPNNSWKRTLLVIDSDKHTPYRGAVSVVDQKYIEAYLGYQADNRIEKLIVKVGDDYYPPNSHFVTQRHSVLVSSPQQRFSLQVVASNQFASEQITFYLLSAIPVFFALSLLIFSIIYFQNRRTSLLDDLKKGLERHELFLVYQPIVMTDSGEIHGYEALIRWVNPKLGFITPDSFIPIAEEYGLINKLTDYVLKQVEQDISSFPTALGLHIGINVPPSYLSSQNHIKRLIKCSNTLSEKGLQLTVEITERQLLDEQGKQVLKPLRNAGIIIAIDDFGTGRTALSVLQDITFDCLKIDKCFTDTIGVDSINAPVLNSIIELAHQLNVEIIAEGIEHAYQAEYLKAKGVKLHQGYYYAKPLCLKELFACSPTLSSKH